MPAARLLMRKIKEILKLKFEHRLPNRAVARSVGVSPGTVCDVLGRAKVAGIGWPLREGMGEKELEALMYATPEANEAKVVPDLQYIHKELRRKGVTLMLLWQEYKQQHLTDGYQYSQFCELYRRFSSKVDVVLRQHHHAGEKMFTDYSGDGIPYTDRQTGEVRKAELFVAVLGASNYSYVEAHESQRLRDWIMGHVHALEYFDGVPEIFVPDNTKTAVIRPSRYEPDLNRSFVEMANHYGAAIVPTRVAKPRDKAKVESAVLITQRWILAALRNHQFFSVAEINEAIGELLEKLNTKKFQKLDGTRRDLYVSLDKPALMQLPSKPYEFADWANRKVNIDYHVDVGRHYYSVPYQLVRERVDVRITATVVEIFYKGTRVASHKRSNRKGAHTTNSSHMPKSHKAYTEWNPDRILNWAGQTGPQTKMLAEKILKARRHPEQGFRSCLGLMRLGKDFGEDRLEVACMRALYFGTWSYKSVKSILKTGLDKQPLPDTTNHIQNSNQGNHENIRGAGYYH